MNDFLDLWSSIFHMRTGKVIVVLLLNWFYVLKSAALDIIRKIDDHELRNLQNLIIQKIPYFIYK